MNNEISRDGAFYTTPEGDVEPAHEGVNAPLPTPRGGMPHYRADIAGLPVDLRNDEKEPQVEAQGEPTVPEWKLDEHTREVGRMGVVGAKEALRRAGMN